MQNIENSDYNMRCKALEFAITAYDRDTAADVIVSAAEEFHDFLSEAQECKILRGTRHEGAFIPPAPVVVPKEDKPEDSAWKIDVDTVEREQNVAVDPFISSKDARSTRSTPIETTKIKGKKLDALREIIKLNDYKISATRAEVARRIDMGANNIARCVSGLIKSGFVKEDRISSRHIGYIALKDEHGNAVASKVTPVKDEETGITHCPPAYADGYGFDKSQFEDL